MLYLNDKIILVKQIHFFYKQIILIIKKTNYLYFLTLNKIK
jgi:hypothetical protein